MIANYYFWKWADNDLPGKPLEVYAWMLKGDLHPALQTFDARQLIRRFEKAANAGRKKGEEWDWQVHPRQTPESASYVWLSCPEPNNKAALKQFSDLHFPLLAAFDEATVQLRGLPKHNRFSFGQYPADTAYDISPDDLPVLLRAIRSGELNPYAILENARGNYVQCYRDKKGFCVEWRNNYDFHDFHRFDHWRAQDIRKLRALDPSADPRKAPPEKDPELLRFADTLRIFEAFVRGETRPDRYHWRHINHELP